MRGQSTIGEGLFLRTIRIFFEKRSRAKYISHLDCTRCMQRAIKRAGLPVWYTEGFNPHLYLTFALPLALGYEGLRETMDIRLMDDDMPLDQVQDRLNAVLPQGFRVVQVSQAKGKPAEIAWAQYQVLLGCDGTTPRELLELWRNFDVPGPILVQKKGKKGMKEVDIRPFFETLEAHITSQGLQLGLRFAAGNVTNINPTLALDRFFDENSLAPSQLEIVRTRVLTQDLEEFC